MGKRKRSTLKRNKKVGGYRWSKEVETKTAIKKKSQK